MQVSCPAVTMACDVRFFVNHYGQKMYADIVLRQRIFQTIGRAPHQLCIGVPQWVNPAPSLFAISRESLQWCEHSA
jgi:hypothetical protein